MSSRFAKCTNCPANHLLTDERKVIIESWEHERQRNIDRIKETKLILLGESMPSKRYFYDLETDFTVEGMRYNLKKEFDQLEISDSQFLESLISKGIVLYDCALCPIHLFDNNVDKRKAATYCFLTQNISFIEENNDVPIATIFPSKRGWLKTKIHSDIKNRVSGKFGFQNVSGLKDLYLKIEKEGK